MPYLQFQRVTRTDRWPHGNGAHNTCATPQFDYMLEEFEFFPCRLKITYTLAHMKPDVFNNGSLQEMGHV